MKCTVTSKGTLTACQVLSETPEDYGFGDATLKIARFFKLKPKTVDGNAVEGGSYTFSIKWAVPT